MAKSKEVSNKTLLILIVAVTVVTIVSTWFIVDAAFEAKVLTGDNVETGKVSLSIEGGEEVVTDLEPQSAVGEASIEIEETAANAE